MLDLMQQKLLIIPNRDFCSISFFNSGFIEWLYSKDTDCRYVLQYLKQMFVIDLTPWYGLLFACVSLGCWCLLDGS